LQAINKAINSKFKTKNSGVVT